MNKTIFHIDLNCFYASVEMLLHPEYRTLPLAVVGDKKARKGIILAKNPKAKVCGIETGELIHEAQLKCPNLVCVQAEFFTYLDYSKRVRKVYEDYTNQIESFGIDEAWLDMSHHKEPLIVARKIADQIRFELGLTVSIGISDNKIFAKLASDLAGTDEIVAITHENIPTVVWPLPVRNLLYVGRATEKKLALFDILTIGDLQRQSLPFLRRHFGKWGEILYTFCHGLDASPVKEFNQEIPIKSIGNSMTCPKDCTTFEQLKVIITILSESVASRLKKAGFLAQTVTLYVRNQNLESLTRQGGMEMANDLAEQIMHKAWQLCQENVDLAIPIRSLGIQVSHLIYHNQICQLSLFDDSEKTRTLEIAMEAIRSRFGHQAIQRAVTQLDHDFKGLNPREEHIIFPENYFR